MAEGKLRMLNLKQIINVKNIVKAANSAVPRSKRNNREKSTLVEK